MSDWLWPKALHLFFMVAWFAGIFYLPRLFVNHAATQDQPVLDERFRMMERKLYRFITPWMILTVVFGLCAEGRNRHSERWYRWFNELPVFLLLAIVLLASLLAIVGHEVDLHTLEVLERTAVHDELETLVFAYVVFVGELIGEGHAEVDAAAATRAGEHAHAFDVLFHLASQLLHLLLCRRGEAEILIAELIYACRHFEIYLSIA